MIIKAKNMDAFTTGNILGQKLKGSVGPIGKYLRIQRKKEVKEGNL